MNLNYHLTALPLPSFSEYLETHTFLKIANGGLSSEGSISLGPDNDGHRAILDLNLNDIEMEDTRTGDKLLSLTRFNLDDLQIDTTHHKVGVGLINLRAPDLFVRMSPEKKINLVTLSKPRDHLREPSGHDKNKNRR